LLLCTLLLVCIAAWLQAFISLEIRPRAVQNAQQLASLVNLSRASLLASDPIGRVLLIKSLADQEALHLTVRQAGDRYTAHRMNWLQGDIVERLRQQIGASAVVAEAVNGQPGLWIGFEIESDAYWLRTDEARLAPTRPGTWLLWLLTAGALSLLGSVLITRLINRPLHQLVLASARLRHHQAQPAPLDEQASTTEIRELNIAFNRMSEQLAKVEQERNLLLAGISHDLRTPLTRLRLEAQMSVPQARARQHMEADIAQIDAIVGKFLAHPPAPALQSLALAEQVAQASFAWADDPQVHISVQIEPKLHVRADPVELARVLSNLLDNASHHGRSADGICRIELRASATQAWVLLTVTDQGPGVAPEQLHQLTRPYHRATSGPSGPPGSGLGLAIAESAMQRMGGGFSLSLAANGGLCASLRLRRA
jgi:two-component system osmolarity sensor histidine kinase EnvZ